MRHSGRRNNTDGSSRRRTAHRGSCRSHFSALGCKVQFQRHCIRRARSHLAESAVTAGVPMSILNCYLIFMVDADAVDKMVCTSLVATPWSRMHAPYRFSMWNRRP